MLVDILCELLVRVVRRVWVIDHGHGGLGAMVDWRLSFGNSLAVCPGGNVEKRRQKRHCFPLGQAPLAYLLKTGLPVTEVAGAPVGL